MDVIQRHSHTLYTEPINNVIITSAGCYAQRLGVLSLKKAIAVGNVKDETRVNLTDTYT